MITIRKIVFRLLPLVLLCALGAAAQTTTTVADSLFSPTGSAVSGSIRVSANETFTAADGTVVPKGVVIYVPVTNGAFSVNLVPNIGSNPPGSSYTASYSLTDGEQYNETWIVPQSATAVNLSAVRTSPAPSPTVTFAISQINPPSPCSAGEVLYWSGSWACETVSGTGTVTTFSAGSLSPLFSTSVSNASTAPSLSFTLSNAAAGTLFGNDSASSAAPGFYAPSSFSLPLYSGSFTLSDCVHVASVSPVTFSDAGAACGSGSGSMVYPSGSGIAVVNAGASWGTTLAAPSGAIVGTSDTQTITNKTLDGVTPTIFGYLDATSSIQTQLNAKAAATASMTISGVACQLSSTCTILYSELGGLPTLAATIAAASHEWLASYSSTTGLFTQSQPAFSDLSGDIAVSQMNSGTGASATTFWRGDGTWATPSGSGNVTGPSSAVDGDFASYNGTTGTIIKDSGIASASVSQKPASTDEVQYVSINGSDSNDGDSWGTAKLTLQAAINVACSTSSTGGVIYVGSGVFTVSTQISLPNNGASSPVSYQTPCRIIGVGSSANGEWSAGDIGFGTTLDLTYDASVAKIVTTGSGKLVIEHITLEDTSTDCAPFIQTTNTTLVIRDDRFFGTASGTSACNDAIILGGTTATIGTATGDAFQGYGTVIQNNFFSKINVAVLGQQAANGIVISGNTVSANCGGSTTPSAPFQFTGGGSSNINTGLNAYSNVEELTNYTDAWILTNVENSYVHADGWDGGTALFYLSGVTSNDILSCGNYPGTISLSTCIDPSSPAYSAGVKDQIIDGDDAYMYITNLNGAAIPASTALLGTNSSTQLTATTAAQVATLLQGLTGCSTATYLFSPQGSDCVAPSAGSGDVTGPSSSTAGDLPDFSDTTGKVLADSGIPDTAAGFNAVIQGLTGCTTSGYVLSPANSDCVAISGGGAFAGGAGTSYQDAEEIAAPADPASGYDRLYMDSTTHELTCLTSSGTSCMPSSSSSGTSFSQTGIAFGSSAGDGTTYTVFTAPSAGLYLVTAYGVVTTASAGCTTTGAGQPVVHWTDAESGAASYVGTHNGSTEISGSTLGSGVLTDDYATALLNLASGATVTIDLYTATAPVGCTTSAVISLHAGVMPQ